MTNKELQAMLSLYPDDAIMVIDTPGLPPVRSTELLPAEVDGATFDELMISPRHRRSARANIKELP